MIADTLKIAQRAALRYPENVLFSEVGNLVRRVEAVVSKDDKKPGTRTEAILWTIENLSDEDKANVRKMNLDDFLLDGHFGLGMWIRNELFYDNHQRERLEASMEREYRFIHPDDLSTKLLTDVWTELQCK